MPGQSQAYGGSAEGPRRPRPRRGGKRTPREPPGRAPHRGPGRQARLARPSSDHPSAPRDSNSLGESAARSRARRGTPRPPTDAVGHAWARTGATNDLPAGLAGPPTLLRITGTTGTKRYGGPLIRPGHRPLYVREQPETAGLTWTQRDITKRKETAPRGQANPDHGPFTQVVACVVACVGFEPTLG
jgi:hypothetical protein